MMCPDCRGSKIRRLRRNTLILYWKGLTGVWPYRCEQCAKEFFLPQRRPERGSDGEPLAKKAAGGR